MKHYKNSGNADVFPLFWHTICTHVIALTRIVK